MASPSFDPRAASSWSCLQPKSLFGFPFSGACWELWEELGTAGKIPAPHSPGDSRDSVVLQQENSSSTFPLLRASFLSLAQSRASTAHLGFFLESEPCAGVLGFGSGGVNGLELGWDYPGNAGVWLCLSRTIPYPSKELPHLHTLHFLTWL